MNKNILAENMRRFHTKNLNEQSTPAPVAEPVAEPAIEPIQNAKDDSTLMSAIADWAAQHNSIEELTNDIKKLAKSAPDVAKKITDFFQRNKTNVEIRNKQIARATRRYRADQAGSKVATPAGIAGAVGAVLMLTFGKLGDIFRQSFGQF